MTDIRTTTTNYRHPTDPNLLNIHKAMKFNSEGEPVVRTHVDGISLQGDVIVDTVSLSSSTLAALESVSVQNNVSATITGSVFVSNFPSTSTVYQGTTPWNITGTVQVSNTVTVNQGSTPWLVSNINNYDIDNAPWQLQVAMGKVAGVTGLSLSGYGPSVGTEFIPAWELNTAYTYLPSAQTIRVWSSSASDTNVSVLISGLDSTYTIQTETVVLTNGATGVMSTKQFLRVNSIAITGSVQNVGSIRVGSSDKTITLAYMGDATNVTAGRSQMSVYTVPAGYTFYLTQSNWYTNQTGSQTAIYRSWTRSPAGLISIVLTFPMQQQYNSTKVVPRAYPEKTDIQWQVASSSGSSKIGGQVEGYLIQNGL